MNLFRYFTKFEWCLWCFSVVSVIAAFVLFDRINWVNPLSAIIGVSYIIINAKGNPIGQALGLVFSVAYGFIALGFGYYGEMVTYMGMTAPMAVVALIAWLRHPFRQNRAEVAVKCISKREMAFAFVLSAAVTILFYFILISLNTANLIPSTISVYTSFLAVYLTARRSEWFSLAYAANDIVLIVLWSLAAFENLSYVSVIVCFVMFFINDIYAFLSWRKMRRMQQRDVAAMTSFDQ